MIKKKVSQPGLVRLLILSLTISVEAKRSATVVLSTRVAKFILYLRYSSPVLYIIFVKAVLFATAIVDSMTSKLLGFHHQQSRSQML